VRSPRPQRRRDPRELVALDGLWLRFEPNTQGGHDVRRADGTFRTDRMSVETRLD
jgi:hypothetical protein